MSNKCSVCKDYLDIGDVDIYDDETIIKCTTCGSESAVQVLLDITTMGIQCKICGNYEKPKLKDGKWVVVSCKICKEEMNE